MSQKRLTIVGSAIADGTTKPRRTLGSDGALIGILGGLAGSSPERQMTQDSFFYQLFSLGAIH